VKESVLAAYAAGRAAAYFPDHFADRQARARAVQRARRPLTPQTLAALRAQNEKLGPNAARAAHLAALGRGATVVVTGQQVGLFLGPLYTLYKAASAIAVSRALARETATEVVPIFWLQTEDHDLPEIASCSLPRDGQPPLELRVPASADARVSLAHCALPDEIAASTAALRAELERLPFAAPHLERLERAYRSGETWGDAFKHVIAELFANEGLLVIDPRAPELASLAAPVHARALREAGAIASVLEQRCGMLKAEGFEPQVHVRPGAPLCFFHAAGAHDERCRLVPCERGFKRVGHEHAEHTLDELLGALEREPLRFSSSALLRPIVQDTLLPTAAYVGGPGEIAYFAQLSPLYEAFGMAMPLIVPRARFRVIEDKILRVLQRLQVSADDALGDAAAIAAAHAAQSGAFAPEALEAQLRARFDEAIDAALQQTGPLQEQLKAARDKTKAAVHGAAAKLADKHRSALAHQNDAVLRDVARVQQALEPGGEPQERVYGFPYYAARYGERAFVERIVQALDTTDPFDPALRDLHP
jgi:bacillithiol biosynthesis cysteine-adding enzyme BshC